MFSFGKPAQNGVTEKKTCSTKTASKPHYFHLTVSHRNHVLDEHPDGQGKEAIFGGCPAHWKAWKSLLRRFRQQESKTITATADGGSWQPDRYHIKFPSRKNLPLRCGLSSKFFDHSILLWRTIYDLDLRIWRVQCQDEPARQISTSDVTCSKVIVRTYRHLGPDLQKKS